jgi:hypothetical protein
VVGQHQSRALGADSDLGYPSAHRLDSEGDTCPEHFAVEDEVGLDIPTRHIQDIERLDRHDLIFPTHADPASRVQAVALAIEKKELDLLSGSSSEATGLHPSGLKGGRGLPGGEARTVDRVS